MCRKAWTSRGAAKTTYLTKLAISGSALEGQRQGCRMHFVGVLGTHEVDQEQPRMKPGSGK